MTANFRHPFQCIRYVERKLNGFQSLLVASAASNIYTYSAETGHRLSIWPRDLGHSKNGESPSTADVDSIPKDQGPPEKKRKISEPGDGVKEFKGSAQPAYCANVPLLALTSNGHHLVAVTAEDKCIRVLRIKEDGLLQHLSAR